MLYFKTYGPIVKVHDGPLNTLVAVKDENFIEYILSSTKLITKSNHYSFFYNWLGTGLLTSTGKTNLYKCKLIKTSFNHIATLLE